MYQLCALMSTQTLDGEEINYFLFLLIFKLLLESKTGACCPSYNMLSLNKTQGKM